VVRSAVRERGLGNARLCLVSLGTAAVLTACGTGTPSSSSSVAQISPSSATVGQTQALDEALATDGRIGAINTYWDQAFPLVWPRIKYAPPTQFVPYQSGEVPGTACGHNDPNPDHFANNAQYCFLDETIAYDVTFLQKLQKARGSFAPIAVLAHEWGHRIQHLSNGRHEFTIQDELQADCYAGLFTNYAKHVGTVTENDVQGAASEFYSFGASQGDWLWFAPQSHGTAQDRLLSFVLGAVTGTVSTCLISSPSGSVVAAGPYRVAAPRGATTSTTANGSVTLISHSPGPDGVYAQLHGFEWAALSGGGDAPSRFNLVASNWFRAASVSWGQQFEGYAAGTNQIAIGSFIPSDQTYFARTYDAQFASETRHGVLLLAVRPGFGGLLIEAYALGSRPSDMTPVYNFLVALLYGTKAG
jgi:predicted metalloprotease